jgi:hypothetical protein
MRSIHGIQKRLAAWSERAAGKIFRDAATCKRGTVLFQVVAAPFA